MCPVPTPLILLSPSCSPTTILNAFKETSIGLTRLLVSHFRPLLPINPTVQSKFKLNLEMSSGMKKES